MIQRITFERKLDLNQHISGYEPDELPITQSRNNIFLNNTNYFSIKKTKFTYKMFFYL